jgi:hypothetical protein
MYAAIDDDRIAIGPEMCKDEITVLVRHAPNLGRAQAAKNNGGATRCDTKRELDGTAYLLIARDGVCLGRTALGESAGNGKEQKEKCR